MNHKTCSIDAVNKKSNYGETALDWANNNTGPLKNEIIQLLKSKGALTSEELDILNKMTERKEFYVDNQNTCSICLNEFTGNDANMIIKLDCGHIFHTDCLLKWFKTSNLCPFCKQKSKSYYRGKSIGKVNDDEGNFKFYHLIENLRLKF